MLLLLLMMMMIMKLVDDRAVGCVGADTYCMSAARG